jgi:hypothetical protein
MIVEGDLPDPTRMTIRLPADENGYVAGAVPIIHDGRIEFEPGPPTRFLNFVMAGGHQYRGLMTAGALDRITTLDPTTGTVNIRNIQNFVGSVSVFAGFSVMTPPLPPGCRQVTVNATFSGLLRWMAAALPGYANAELWLNLIVS